MEMIPQTIMQSNSKDDDLFLDDEINDVSAEVQHGIFGGRGECTIGGCD
ncbi:7062_t:CDS:2 [Entrophospora sp. SA101]|nr:7062_t:CDS:2 [Entrophospora sp. SA101]